MYKESLRIDVDGRDWWVGRWVFGSGTIDIKTRDGQRTHKETYKESLTQVMGKAEVDVGWWMGGCWWVLGKAVFGIKERDECGWMMGKRTIGVKRTGGRWWWMWVSGTLSGKSYIRFQEERWVHNGHTNHHNIQHHFSAIASIAREGGREGGSHEHHRQGEQLAGSPWSPLLMYRLVIVLFIFLPLGLFILLLYI